MAGSVPPRPPRRTASSWKTGTWAVLAVTLVLVPIASAQQKHIYIGVDDHTDYMWTANEAVYRSAFIEMLDYYLNLADSTAGNAPEFQSRFNTDGTFWLWEYERNKPAADYDRLIGRIRSGHISVPLNALVVTYGAQPAEAVLRGMYYAGRIERRHDLRFSLAQAMENQTLPLGLSSLWAGAGARFSWKGVCGCATNVPNLGNRQQEIYRYRGLDGRSILMKWNSLVNAQQMGGYAEARDPFGIVDYVDTNASFIARYPYGVIGAFGKGWDDLKTLTSEFVTAAQNKTTPSRKVFVSNEEDFFLDFESASGAGLPSQTQSYGNEWDLYSASLAEVSSSVRRSVEKLRGAEGLATLVSLVDPAFWSSRKTSRDLATIDLGVYWEHGWTADGSVPDSQRATWQRRLASEIKSYVDTLQSDAAASLGGMIPRPGANERFFVYNPLSWTRDDMADLPRADTAVVHVVEVASGQEVPSQIVMVDGQRRLRILASAVPSMGYKVYEIQPGAGGAFSPAATVTGSVIENGFHAVTVADRGAITSLVDKQRGNRQFARTVGGKVINDLGTGTGTLSVESSGPVSVTLRAVSSGPIAHQSRITLIRGLDRIDIRNDITQNFSDVRTWAFGFELTSPDVRHEEVGAVLRAKLLGSGGHYSPVNARYGWLSLNHFADMTDGAGTVGVTLSNADTSFMRLGSSTGTSLDTTTPQFSPLAGGQVDGASLGIQGQGGDSQFLQRFALRTHGGYDAVSAMRFALEHQNPFVTGTVTGGTGYPADSYSFLSISDPSVILWALKPVEEGIDQGVVVRAWNLGSGSSAFSLSLAGGIAGADNSTHIETPLGPATVTGGALSGTAPAQGMVTYRLDPAGNPPPPTPSLSIGDVTVTEGNAGTVNAVFTVTLSAASASTVTVNHATANGTATAPSDYVAASGPVSFTPGATSRTVAVTVNGDTTVEPTETFLVNLSGASGATIADGQGQGTITNDDSAGTARAVMVSPPPGSTLTSSTVTFTWTTGTGVTSYVLQVGTTLGGGQIHQAQYSTTSATVTGLPTNGSTVYVRLASRINGVWQSNDYTYTAMSSSSASLSINDVTLQEGQSGTTNAVFTVTRSGGTSQTVTVNYATANGTALAGSDYVSTSGPLSFAPGVTTQTLSVAVNGDTTVEPSETFVVNLSGATNATIADGQGQGTITNDDSAPPPAKAVMTSPPPGSTLLSSTVTFMWTTGTSVTSYVLQVGTTSGGGQIHQAQYSTTSATVSGLPTNGSTVYVRLASRINGAWQFNDYTYTAAGP